VDEELAHWSQIVTHFVLRLAKAAHFAIRLPIAVEQRMLMASNNSCQGLSRNLVSPYKEAKTRILNNTQSYYNNLPICDN
jgi:hypothetical protein